MSSFSSRCIILKIHLIERIFTPVSRPYRIVRIQFHIKLGLPEGYEICSAVCPCSEGLLKSSLLCIVLYRDGILSLMILLKPKPDIYLCVIHLRIAGISRLFLFRSCRCMMHFILIFTFCPLFRFSILRVIVIGYQLLRICYSSYWSDYICNIIPYTDTAFLTMLDELFIPKHQPRGFRVIPFY